MISFFSKVFDIITTKLEQYLCPLLKKINLLDFCVFKHQKCCPNDLCSNFEEN